MNNKEIIDILDKFDDPLFKFDPIKHKYTFDGEEYTSVTKFISNFHNKFDTDKWSVIKAEENGISKSEMISKWKKINDRSNVIGTSLHNYIENYFKKIYQDIPIDLDVVDRINKFNILYSKHLHKLSPIKFEQRVFSKKIKIAGMMDSIFMFNDKILILDWKSNKSFETDNSSRGQFEYLLPPFDHLWKNHLNEYSIQISMYMLILKEHGIDISQGYLVHIGPNSDPKIHKCLNLVSILESYFNI